MASDVPRERWEGMLRTLAALALVMVVASSSLAVSGASATVLSPLHRVGVVLDVGSPGSYDSTHVRFPAVLRDTDGTYRMWYSGYDGFQNRIMSAVSSDGIHWTKTGVVFNTDVPPFYWQSAATESVMKIGSVYHMWFGAGFWSGGPYGYWAQIYHAISLDAVTWNVTGVALPPGSGWDAGMVNIPSVVRADDGTFWMAFTGWDGTQNRIGMAVSTDGERFVEVGANPVVGLGPSGSWDSTDVEAPDLVLSGSAWTMYYTGYNGSDAIGVARSADGFNWTKDPINPLLVGEAPPAWDQGASNPAVLPGTGWMYYAGGNRTNIRIGLVTGLGEGGGAGSVPSAGIPVVAVVGLILAVGVAGIVAFASAVRPRRR